MSQMGRMNSKAWVEGFYCTGKGTPMFKGRRGIRGAEMEVSLMMTLRRSFAGHKKHLTGLKPEK